MAPNSAGTKSCPFTRLVLLKKISHLLRMSANFFQYFLHCRKLLFDITFCFWHHNSLFSFIHLSENTLTFIQQIFSNLFSIGKYSGCQIISTALDSKSITLRTRQSVMVVVLNLDLYQPHYNG